MLPRFTQVDWDLKSFSTDYKKDRSIGAVFFLILLSPVIKDQEALTRL